MTSYKYRKTGIRSRPQIEALVKYGFYLVDFGQKFCQNNQKTRPLILVLRQWSSKIVVSIPKKVSEKKIQSVCYQVVVFYLENSTHILVSKISNFGNIPRFEILNTILGRLNLKKLFVKWAPHCLDLSIYMHLEWKVVGFYSLHLQNWI